MCAIKNPIKVFLLFLVIFCVSAVADANYKKFDFKKSTKQTEALQSDSIKVPEDPAEIKTSSTLFFVGSAETLQKLTDAQKILREKISAKIEKLKNGESGTLIPFLAICLLYGLLHALGPGHGKTIVVSYFLSRRGKFSQGIALGSLITTIHTLSAVILLFILYGIAKATLFPLFETSRVHIEKASYALVAITGVILILVSLREILRKQKTADSHLTATWKELLWLAFITGIVPCPAVALIVFFCLLQGIPGIALLGSFFICIGMTLTNASFGLLAICTHRGLDKGIQRIHAFEKYASGIYFVLSIACGICIVLTGIALFLSAR